MTGKVHIQKKTKIQWQAWGPEAFAAAQEQNKPIFLSIGYAGCPGYERMVAESFQDPEIVTLLNRAFIAILIDAKERPDIDRVYQAAYQIIHRQPGGWPLTVFLTPTRQMPFLIGTYFPKDPAQGAPSFKDLLEQVLAYYQLYASQLERHYTPLVTALEALSDFPTQDSLDSMNDRPWTIARIEWEQAYDPLYSGFGLAPKFPNTGFLEGLLQYWSMSLEAQEEDKMALQMPYLSLQKMALSALYDKKEGGFYRFTLDAGWKKPYPEKSVPENAVLMVTYCQAYQCVADPLFKDVIEQSMAWLLKQPKKRTMDAAVVKACLVAARVLDCPEWGKQGLRILKALSKTLRLAYLDDYAFLLDAILTRLEYQWSTEDLKWGIELAETLIHRFEDEKRGGFYFTPEQAEPLLVRPKSFAEEALPSGNSLAACCFLRLGYLLGEIRYLTTAARILKAADYLLHVQPSACSHLLKALEDYLHPPEVIIVRGKTARSLLPWREALGKGYAPQRFCVFIPEDEHLPKGLARFTLGKKQGVCAYVRDGIEGLPPITSLEDFRARFLMHTQSR